MRYSREETVAYLADLISNIEGASFALASLTPNPPLEHEIGAWKNHGRQDGFRGHSLETWETANELRKYKRSARRILANL